MIPIPAIDLRGGQVVRLLQGNFKAETVYADGPDMIARRFQEEGAERIHVVDLDGALKGKPANQGLIEKILKSVSIPLEVGGGIRDLKIAENYFDMGIRWAILGTRASLDLGFAKEAVREYGEKIIFGIDARDGLVATDGWTKITKLKAVTLAKDLEALGGKTIIYTDIAKDGALAGPNLSEIKTMSETVTMDVIASGGVGQLKDIQGITKLSRANILGVIIGKALYEGKFKLSDAVKQCSQKD